MASCKATVCLGKENICKNCIKADVCKVAEEFDKEPVDGIYIEGCEHFKDRNRFVELPCRVGSIVYIIPTTGNRLKEVTKAKCISFLIGGVSNTSNLLFCGTSKSYFAGFDRFGKTVFLTREEAERALKERENNG